MLCRRTSRMADFFCLPVHPVYKMRKIGSAEQTGRKGQKGRKPKNRLYSCIFETMLLENQWFAKFRVGQIPPCPPDSLSFRKLLSDSSIPQNVRTLILHKYPHFAASYAPLLTMF